MCDGGYTLCDTCGARTTPIPRQRARVLSVGKKSPSFSFYQVDMYEVPNNESWKIDNHASNRCTKFEFFIGQK